MKIILLTFLISMNTYAGLNQSRVESLLESKISFKSVITLLEVKELDNDSFMASMEVDAGYDQRYINCEFKYIATELDQEEYFKLTKCDSGFDWFRK